MAFSFSETDLSRIEEIRRHYSTNESALLPVLHLAQKLNGWISPEVMSAVAEVLKIPLIKVEDVATFYTMFNKQPVGRFHIQVCNNISCYLNGSGALIEHLQRKLQLKPGETDSGGKFTLSLVECLGACGGAPVVQINDEYYENCTPESLDQILDSLE
jgi:NADH-quinone oxidoreductase subunit E